MLDDVRFCFENNETANCYAESQISDYAEKQGKSREHIFAKIWMVLEDEEVAKEYNIVCKATLLEVCLPSPLAEKT
jgi:hypothetical protein